MNKNETIRVNAVTKTTKICRKTAANMLTPKYFMALQMTLILLHNQLYEAHYYFHFEYIAAIIMHV